MSGKKKKKKNVTVNKNMQKNQDLTSKAEAEDLAKSEKAAEKTLHPAAKKKAYAKKKTAQKRSVAAAVRPVFDFFRENITLDIAIAFGVFVLALILVGALGLKEAVVPVCFALILEAGIAVMMHNAQLWVHGAAAVLQLVAGALIARMGMMVLCIVLYVLTIAALQLLEKYGKRAKRI